MVVTSEKSVLVTPGTLVTVHAAAKNRTQQLFTTQKAIFISRLSVFLQEEHVLGVLGTWRQYNVLIGGKERLHMVYSG